MDLIVLNDKVEIISKILLETYKKVSDALNMKCEYTGEVLVGESWYDCH